MRLTSACWLEVLKALAVLDEDNVSPCMSHFRARLFARWLIARIWLSLATCNLIGSSEEEQVIVLIAQLPPAGGAPLPGGETLLQTLPAEDMATDSAYQLQP